MEVISANATNVLQCTNCSFRTLRQDRFFEHRMEHVQLLQQRLMTTIKRSVNDEQLRAKTKRVPRKTDKMHTCDKCSFRCESVAAIMQHLEFHGNAKALYKCAICDYGANTHNILIFHEQNHHLLDGSFTDMRQQKALMEGNLKEIAKFGPDAPTAIRCGRCSFACHEFRDLDVHMEKEHRLNSPSATAEDKELSAMLSMSIIPRSSVLTTN
jgi:DNA-directed RNA polymerase subunit RPC12/RpoP